MATSSVVTIPCPLTRHLDPIFGRPACHADGKIEFDTDAWRVLDATCDCVDPEVQRGYHESFDSIIEAEIREVASKLQ